MLLPSPLSPLRLHVSMHLAESGWTQVDHTSAMWQGVLTSST